ncbi:MAG: homocysteine S-methyltransferase family protein [Armatimonadota bacterium]
MSKFLDLIEHKPVICDGAVGTEIHRRSGRMDQCLDSINLTNPDLIRQIHHDYAAAGAQILETNTFGANRIRLSAHGLAGSVREINMAGARIAREEAKGGIVVAGSMGSTGKILEPYGALLVDEAREVFDEQAEALKDGGVDVIFVETMADLNEATAAVSAAKATGLPIVAQMSFSQEGRTMMGVDPATAVRTFEGLGADVVGANCGTGFHDMLGVVREMVAVAARPVIAQPNAGFPQFVDGRLVYVSGPAYMADYARQFADLGVAIIGGCCGTTPEHIRAIAQALGR